MKMTKISELPIIPENYAVENYMRISNMDIKIHMTENERRFINGLISFYEPQNILEVGVHRGEGTINIKNASASIESRVVSIDKAVEWFQFGKTCRPGEMLTEIYPEFKRDNWKLITGKDPSEVMDQLNIKFDFAVIDSGHDHPCEALNFITILPYLNDGAIVVLHDITNWMYPGAEGSYAPPLLLSSVCAEKILCKSEELPFPNIAAFQVTPDTRKYSQNVFDVLLLPWRYFDKKDVENIYAIVKKHYSSKEISTFEMAVDMAQWQKRMTMKVFGFSSRSVIKKAFNRLDNDTVFYGAGRNYFEMRHSLTNMDINFDYQIWDKNAENIQKAGVSRVSLPDFETKARPQQIMVITIANQSIYDTVRKQFEHLGYTVYHGVGSLIKTMDDLRRAEKVKLLNNKK